MFEAKDIIGNAVAATLKLFTAHKRGDVVPWQSIYSASGFDKESPHWTAFNARFRRDFLSTTGIAVWPVNGVGLKLVTHEFQMKELPLLRQKRALRQNTRALKAVRALPDNELSDHQRQMKSVKIEQLRKARRDALASVRMGTKLLKPFSSGIPRVKTPTKAA